MTLRQNISQYGKVTSFLAENNARIFQLHTGFKPQLNEHCDLADADRSQFLSAYMNNTYWMCGLAYPVCHLLRLITDIGHLFQGLTLLLRLKTTRNAGTETSSLQQALYCGLANNASAIGLDILNIIVSAITFITQSIVTLMYGIKQNPTLTVAVRCGNSLFHAHKAFIRNMCSDLIRGTADEQEILARSIPTSQCEDEYREMRNNLGFV